MKMSEEETIEVRQEHEWVALQSIYFEDIKDLRKPSVWNKWKPLELSLLLKPPLGSLDCDEVETQVELHINCSDKYPNVPPCISLENPRGISHNVLNKFKEKLEAQARELCGEVMIHSLAEMVRAFLDEHKKPASKSCYEEMQRKKHQREQDELERQRLEMDRQRQTLLDEVLQRQEIQKSEPKRWREQRLSSESSSRDGQDMEYVMRRNNSSELSDESSSCHQNTEIIGFCSTEVQRGACINHNKPNRIIYGGMSTEDGKLHKVIEWIIEFKSLDAAQKQISSIEKEFHYLTKLKHCNLIRYLGFNYSIVKSENKVVVHILQEFVSEVNFKHIYILNNIPIEMDMLRYMAQCVLSALDHLHRNNVIHRDISSSSVYINKQGVIQLANYSLDKRLSDLAISGNTSTSHSKKTDIFKFGLLVLSLLQGRDIGDKCDLPNGICKELQDFLEKMLSKEEKDRHSAVQLLNHPFIKVPLTKFHFNGNGDQKLPDEHMGSPPDSQNNDIESNDFKMQANLPLNGESRAVIEFHNLGFLGKGAFGAVFKVKNKLDQRIYALKRITLNPKNKQLNKKMIREVKLLSGLNHENVVRYYNSWIETGISRDETSSSEFTATSSINENKKERKNTDEFLNEELKNIELLAPPMRNTPIAVSYGNKSLVNDGDESSSSSSDEFSDDDDDDDWTRSDDEDDDFVKFERTNAENEKTLDVVDSIKTDTPAYVDKASRVCQYMYIQMEFCEKSTLRTAIDNDLYLNNDRVWRLFREIIEGLSHIHLQGMIHRDLKPMNIFLDHKDHVKIGDFGLATSNLLTKPNEGVVGNKSYNDYCSNDGGGDPSMTGHIGTALYVAPELSSTAKAMYNQKVDIYSLGIIFFEMCYKPLETFMERCEVLTNLRSENITFPDGFQDKNNKKHIIRWLLDHNYSKRPTAQELLQSDKFPPVVWEESQMQNLLRNTLSNSQLKSYKYLIESCFKQPVKPAQDITYDRGVSVQNITKNLHVYNKIKALITKVFEIHGAQNLSTPLLMPKSKYYGSTETCVKLMTHSGSIVSIPHDLRVPFARYIAWNEVTSFRRYSIERVYREKKVFGFIPRELYECAFDIVTSTPGNFMADAEVLYVLNEVINIVPGFKNKNVHLKLNHMNLLKAIFLYNGIKDNKHNDLFCLLSDAREGKIKKDHLRMNLINKELSDCLIQTLFNCLDEECSISKLEQFMYSIIKRGNSEASSYALQAIKELKTIIKNANFFGIELEIKIAPGLVYNTQQYSGMICQLVCEIKKKHRQGIEVIIAAGGRYDGMVTNFRNMLVDMPKDIKQSAVGVSISLDKLVSVMEKDDLFEQKVDCLDVVVCSLGNNNMVKEKSNVLRSLWAAGIRCCVIEAENRDALQHQCQELNVQHAVILKDTDAKLFSLEKDRMQEKVFSQTEVVEVVQKILKSGGEANSEQSHVYNALNRSESRISHTEHTQEAFVTINYVKKHASNTRKKLENQIHQHLSNVFKKLIGEVICYPVEMDGSLIKTIASHLEWESENAFKKSIEGIMERNQKHKDKIEEICEKIYESKNSKSSPVVILYSLYDSSYKVLM